MPCFRTVKGSNNHIYSTGKRSKLLLETTVLKWETNSAGKLPH